MLLAYAGKVTTKELGSLLRSLGRTPTNGEVTEMVKEVPADGKIDFDMFLGFLARKGQVRYSRYDTGRKIWSDFVGDNVVQALKSEICRFSYLLGTVCTIREVSGRR